METKKCGRCGETKPVAEFNNSKYTKSGYRSQCKMCMTDERLRLREHYKKWREKPETKEMYRAYREKNYERDRIKITARNAARKLDRPATCEVCGKNGKVHGHHDDYSKPLDVRWLCPVCHNAWHRQYGEGRV